MIDLRPIAYITGRMLVVLAILMLVPALVDLRLGEDNGNDILEPALFTGAVGMLVSIAAHSAVGVPLNGRQAYLLTVVIWVVIPLFSALPLMTGAPYLSFTDAYFEATSGITTTGATVIVGLDDMPAGMNLWRGMLNWLGGLGIAFVAMIFLPVMRVGGMQFFRTESFDTFGKVLPRAADIARQLVVVYALLTLACMATYGALGMTPLDAVVHSFATISTGGFSPRDASMTIYAGSAEYAAALFMLLASLPYIRFVQLLNGQVRPLWRDVQVRGYLVMVAVAVGVVVAWRVLTSDMALEPAFREALFNLVSVQSSTGLFSGHLAGWGSFVVVVAFIIGIFGACSGSSAAGLGVFRVQVAFAALRAHVRAITRPDRVTVVKYDGRVVDDDVMGAIILYITGYILILGVLSVGVTLTGVDGESALLGVWSTLGNIGYGFGPMVARTGTFVDYPDAAKWMMVLAMLLGRLGLLAILLLVLPRFWRA
jgi:trk system potassium uptake protein